MSFCKVWDFKLEVKGEGLIQCFRVQGLRVWRFEMFDLRRWCSLARLKATLFKTWLAFHRSFQNVRGSGA